MTKVRKDTVVIDERSCVDDAMSPYAAVRLDHRSCEDNGTFAYLNGGMNVRPRMDYGEPLHGCCRKALDNLLPGPVLAYPRNGAHMPIP